LPFGGEDDCCHNVLRHYLGHVYHQFVFADNTYPPGS
jgi:hypothetical protein